MNHGMNRHLRVARYAVGSLRRRWRKNVALVGVYTVVIFMLASVIFLTQALTQESTASLRSSPEIMVQRLSAGRHGLSPIEDAAVLAQVVGVGAVLPRRWAHLTESATGDTLLVQVAGDGRLRGLEAVAGVELLRRRNLAIGGILTLRGHTGDAVPLAIAGVAETSTPLESAALVVVTEAAFAGLTGMPEGQSMDLGLRVRNRRELPTIAAKIAERYPAARPIIRDELIRTYTSLFNWRSGVIVTILLVPVLAFILFAWDKASGLGPDERREIGILKAVGWETADVILLKSYEAIAVSLAAFMLGAGLAIAVTSFPRPSIVLPALLGWSTLYPDFRPAVVVGAYQIATLFFLTVFPYLVATIVPTWRAGTTDPDLVMRS